MNAPKSFLKFVVTSFILLAFVTIGYVAGQRGDVPQLESTAVAKMPAFVEAATGGKQISLATGRIEEGIEGIFGLDHLTGDLFCWILNPFTGELASTFRFNVTNELGVQGDADYVLCTGLVDIRFNRTGSTRISDSVVYVADGNTGNVLGFSLLYDGRAVGRGTPAAGELRLISRMITRDPSTIRNQGSSGQ